MLRYTRSTNAIEDAPERDVRRCRVADVLSEGGAVPTKGSGRSVPIRNVSRRRSRRRSNVSDRFILGYTQRVRQWAEIGAKFSDFPMMYTGSWSNPSKTSSAFWQSAAP